MLEVGVGSILRSYCSCGYQSDDLYVGGGMRDFGMSIQVPYSCDNCQTVDTTNLLSKTKNDPFLVKLRQKLRCTKCRRVVQFIGELEQNSFGDHTEESNIFEWRLSLDSEEFPSNKVYSLSDESYHCPNCKNTSMKFISIGNWD